MPDCPPGTVAAAAWSRPAWVRSVSADTLSASESRRSTRTDGWCSPRSIWLRYGLERRVRSASWRRVRLALLRRSRMYAPSACICVSSWSFMALLPGWYEGTGRWPGHGKRPAPSASEGGGTGPWIAAEPERARRARRPAAPGWLLALVRPAGLGAAGLVAAGRL